MTNQSRNVRMGKARLWIKWRNIKSIYNLISELAIEGTQTYKSMMRMKHERFYEI